MCAKPLWGKAYRPGEIFQSDNFLHNNRFSCLCNDCALLFNNNSVLHRDIILGRCGKDILALEFSNMRYR